MATGRAHWQTRFAIGTGPAFAAPIVALVVAAGVAAGQPAHSAAETRFDGVPKLLHSDGARPGDSGPGPSFDCRKAATAAETIICRNADLSKSDRNIAEAYARLKRTETPGSFATVQASQRAWLSYVDRSCGDAKPMPEDPGEQNAIQSCLMDNYEDRAQRLGAVDAIKSGALVLEPRMRFFSRSEPGTEESDIYPWMSGAREATAFNAWIAKALQLSKKRMDDKRLFPFDGNLPADIKLYARRTYSVARFDPKVVSLQIRTYDYTGGAHEVLGETALNWNTARAKPIRLGGLFLGGEAWRKFVTDYCLKNLHAQFSEGDLPDPDRSAIEGVVADGSNWLLGKRAATVHFTVYTVASFSAGEFDVKIPYAELKPFLRPGAPVL